MEPRARYGTVTLHEPVETATEESEAGQEPRRVALPASYYLGGVGDPIAQFDHLALVLHPDGRVTWERVD